MRPWVRGLYENGALALSGTLYVMQLTGELRWPVKIFYAGLEIGRFGGDYSLAVQKASKWTYDRVAVDGRINPP